jgi:aryl-alcohol dehydrogenase-like predicted oxidoreductase
VSVIGLGTWQIGGSWGDVAEETALEVLAASVDSGVNFFDTADVYGDGRSERLIARFLHEVRPDLAGQVFVATKMGRRVEQRPELFTLDNFRRWNDRSRENLGVDRLDLVQLHCPPTAVLSTPSVYDALDTMVDEGRMAGYGVSVETCAEALAAIEHPNVASVQIILNAFRLKPLDEVLPAAAERGVAIIARVPLASGLLSGRFTADTTFAANDHRSFNRAGEAFDVGETFSGVDYEAGVKAAQEFAALLPEGMTPAQGALRWVIDQPGVTTVIPGASKPYQAKANAEVATLSPLSADVLSGVRELYDRELRGAMHHRW